MAHHHHQQPPPEAGGRAAAAPQRIPKEIGLRMQPYLILQSKRSEAQELSNFISSLFYHAARAFVHSFSPPAISCLLGMLTDAWQSLPTRVILERGVLKVMSFTRNPAADNVDTSRRPFERSDDESFLSRPSSANSDSECIWHHQHLNKR